MENENNASCQDPLTQLGQFWEICGMLKNAPHFLIFSFPLFIFASIAIPLKKERLDNAQATHTVLDDLSTDAAYRITIYIPLLQDEGLCHREIDHHSPFPISHSPLPSRQPSSLIASLGTVSRSPRASFRPSLVILFTLAHRVLLEM